MAPPSNTTTHKRALDPAPPPPPLRQHPSSSYTSHAASSSSLGSVESDDVEGLVMSFLTYPEASLGKGHTRTSQAVNLSIYRHQPLTTTPHPYPHRSSASP